MLPFQVCRKDNLLNPSDYFTYHQVYNSKILRGAHIAFVCFVQSHNKQRLLPYTALADWVCITEVESVYCTIRTEFLYKTDAFSL